MKYKKGDIVMMDFGPEKHLKAEVLKLEDDGRYILRVMATGTVYYYIREDEIITVFEHDMRMLRGGLVHGRSDTNPV